MDKRKWDPLFQVLYTIVVGAIFFTLGHSVGNGTAKEPILKPSDVFVSQTTTTTTTTTTTNQITTTTTKKSKKTEPAVNYPLSINTATKEELMTIKGIGESYASRIIAHRKKIGGFTDLEQLLEIKGIGEKRLAQWKPYLKL